MHMHIVLIGSLSIAQQKVPNMLLSIASRAVSRTRIVFAQAPADDASPPSSEAGPSDADDGDSKTSLRRFETLPTSYDPEGDAVVAAAQAAALAASQRAAATEARAAELESRISKLRDELDARKALDDEGARIQRAVQRQEEEDSMKMIQFLREQSEAYSTELAEAKAAIEDETIRRMRQESDEAVAEVRGSAHSLEETTTCPRPPALRLMPRSPRADRRWRAD